MGTSAPKPVVDLVEGVGRRARPQGHSARDRKACPERSRRVFLSPDYKEEQLRAEFLNPFFESLGWDVYNKKGLTEVYKPVIHEESTKAPDQSSRIFRKGPLRRRGDGVVRVKVELCS